MTSWLLFTADILTCLCSLSEDEIAELLRKRLPPEPVIEEFVPPPIAPSGVLRVAPDIKTFVVAKPQQNFKFSTGIASETAPPPKPIVVRSNTADFEDENDELSAEELQRDTLSEWANARFYQRWCGSRFVAEPTETDELVC